MTCLFVPTMTLPFKLMLTECSILSQTNTRVSPTFTETLCAVPMLVFHPNVYVFGVGAVVIGGRVARETVDVATVVMAAIVVVVAGAGAVTLYDTSILVLW